MRVLYVDVYFLINFTINIVALFLSARILHISTCVTRLVLLSALGGFIAVIEVLFEEMSLLMLSLSVLFLALVGTLISGSLRVMARVRFVAAFLCVEMLLGGIVWYGYTLLDRYLGDMGEQIGDGDKNRGALIFSVIVLLAIGVLKLFIMMFSGTTDIRSVRIKISACGKEIECDALVDSGNLVKDPINMNPVIFLKRAVAEQIFPNQVLELRDIDALEKSVKKRIRLIPITRGGETHIVTGFLADNVTFPGVCEDNLVATLALDKEEGDYGGLLALVPSSLLSK